VAKQHATADMPVGMLIAASLQPAKQQLSLISAGTVIYTAERQQPDS